MNRQRLNRHLRAPALLGSLLLFAGCAAETTEDVGTLSEGLTVLEATEGELTLAFRQGDDVIFMEALRGQPTADIYRADPEQPAFEVDSRFVSDDGHTFYSARGGDQWLDTTWLAELESQDGQHLSGSNENLFRLATEAAAVMHAELEAQLGAERVAGLGPEIYAIYSFAEQALDAYHEQQANFVREIREQEGLPPLVEGESGDVAYGSGGADDSNWATNTDGYYALGVHHKTIYLFGKHSATQLLYWNNGWVTVHNNCNHGECANGMSAKCYLQYYDTVSPWHTNTMYQQTCSTSYDAWSNDDHNCHDDTRIQMHNKYYGSSIGGSQYWCNDGDHSSDISFGGDTGGSPDCNSNTNTGFRHPWM